MQPPAHHSSYAPASLPLELMHHYGNMSAATSHLMMTDSSVISASAAGGPAGSGPASYTTLLYHPQPLPMPMPLPASAVSSAAMPASSANININISSSSSSTGGIGSSSTQGASSSEASASSPMVGVCVQQNPVVIH
ncbi:serine/threonine-protein kinase minibrain-like [Drosophila grimshawi]|nr:serine/threonine-protein kinase minibrain-like [Drosophila grimshawi]